MTETPTVLDYTKKLTQVVTTHPDYVGDHAELINAITNNHEIVGFMGGFSVVESELDKVVPESLPFSSKPTGEEDAEGEPIMEQKTFREYLTQGVWNESTRAGEVTIPAVVSYNGRGAYFHVNSDQLYALVDVFGSGTIYTKSEFESMVVRPTVEEVL